MRRPRILAGLQPIESYGARRQPFTGSAGVAVLRRRREFRYSTKEFRQGSPRQNFPCLPRRCATATWAGDWTELHTRGGFDVWNIHNVLPASRRSFYEVAFARRVRWFISAQLPALVHQRFFLNHGQLCQRCIDGNFWPAFATGAARKPSHQRHDGTGVTPRAPTPRLRESRAWIAISQAQKREVIKMGLPPERP